MVATKFYNDAYYQNKYYADVAGITLSDLNKMEQEFLSLINYNLYID